MFIGQFKAMQKEPGEEKKEPETTQTQNPESVRSNSSEEFLKTPEAKEFVNGWASRMKDGKPIVTKRGVNDLLGSLYSASNLSNKEIMREADRILMRLTGLDGFSGALSKMRAATEGLVKGLKQALGG